LTSIISNYYQEKISGRSDMQSYYIKNIKNVKNIGNDKTL
jgi:hypothetical protein